MIRFEKDKLIIEIETSTPAETWWTICKSLCNIIRNVNADNIINDTFFAAIDFLEELIPKDEVAKKLQA